MTIQSLKIEPWHAFLVLSVVILVFCLGMVTSIVKPGAVTEMKYGSQFKSLEEIKSRPLPPKDEMLVYPKRAEILFWNDDMKIQGQSFRMFQMETLDKVHDVIAWYGQSWQKKELLVKGYTGEKNGRVEAFDYHNRRFLNVHISRKGTFEPTRIMATAISLPEKKPRYLQHKRSGWETEGKIGDGGKWKRRTEIIQRPLYDAREYSLNIALQAGYEYVSERTMGGQLLLLFEKKSSGEWRYMTLSEDKQGGKTVMQETTIRE